MPFSQYTDLKADKSPLASFLKIQKIPFNVLVNDKGEIIALDSPLETLNKYFVKQKSWDRVVQDTAKNFMVYVSLLLRRGEKNWEKNILKNHWQLTVAKNEKRSKCSEGI